MPCPLVRASPPGRRRPQPNPVSNGNAATPATRAVKPARAFPIHDAHLSSLASATFDRYLDAKTGADYARMPVGESVTR